MLFPCQEPNIAPFHSRRLAADTSWGSSRWRKGNPALYKLIWFCGAASSLFNTGSPSMHTLSYKNELITIYPGELQLILETKLNKCLSQDLLFVNSKLKSLLFLRSSADIVLPDAHRYTSITPYHLPWLLPCSGTRRHCFDRKDHDCYTLPSCQAGFPNAVTLFAVVNNGTNLT